MTEQTFTPKRPHPESDYIRAIAKFYGGQTEVPVTLGGRCDVVTETHAREVEFADKQFEAIGQSLYYSGQLGLKPGIDLLVVNDDDMRFAVRCAYTCGLKGIDLRIHWAKELVS